MPYNRSALAIVKKYHPEVKRVVDAKADAMFEVTKGDCSSATKRAPDACALARAAEREYDGAIVSLNRAYLVKGTTAFRYRVPNAVSRELVSFDRSKKFAPGEYKLKAPSECNRLGKRLGSEFSEAQRGKGKKHSRKYHKTEGIRAL